MTQYSLASLGSPALLPYITSRLAAGRASTAEVLAGLAEFDERKLYLPAAFPSMHAFCVGPLGLTTDVAAKLIQAARAARRFPTLFTAVEDGRLRVSGLCLLAPHLTTENADELIASAAGRTKREIVEWLERRVPSARLLQALAVSRTIDSLDPTQLSEPSGPAAAPGVRETGEQHAPGHVDVLLSAPPTAAPRFELKLSLSAQAHADLREARDLLAHALPSGDASQVVERALRVLVTTLRKRRFGETSQPRPRRSHANGRSIPAAIRREVWERDGGKCTFRSDSGRECQCRRALQYDHIIPVARGGKTTAENLRLRCRAHNQYEAERTFGAGFMQRKREASGQAQAEAREAKLAAAAAKAKEAERARKVEAAVKEVIPALRNLGCSPQQARQVAACCESIPDAPLEERLRFALKGLLPASARRSTAGASGSS